MVRVVIQQLVLFLLPIAAYLVYALWQRRRARRAGVDPIGLEKGPWFWLVIGGLALSIAGFVTLGVSTTGRSVGYEPARIEDGRVVPGQIQ